MISIQDALARWYRMTDHAVTWAPGTDHAGIATQSVVEKKLALEGVTMKDLTPKEFIEKVEEWRDQYGNRILEQMKVLGISTTPSAMYYTKDKTRSDAVNNAFVELWDQGLIYRTTRMVNWCPKLRTAISDMEITSVDIGDVKNLFEDVEFGAMYDFAYKIKGGKGETIVVSTTRPETIPGDQAIAVHPDDERYKHLHYRKAHHPLIPGKMLSIIPDADMVDMTLGTGAVKITPAHDAKDYAFYTRHSKYFVNGKSLKTSEVLVGEQAKPEDAAEESEHIEAESPTAEKTGDRKFQIYLTTVIGRDGTMLRECGIPELVGRDRLRARGAIVKMLDEAGAYLGKKPHSVKVNMCERSGSVIEPMLQPQWYMRMKPLAEKLMAVVEKDGLKFIPQKPHKQLWDQWLNGIQDWCLSRQILWGHQIPAYRVVKPGSKRQGGRWIAAASEEEAKEKMTDKEKKDQCILVRDEDVLDTWFSAGLLPLSTAGLEGKSLIPSDPSSYPLKFIESGSDILFFWLARMGMLCTWFTGKAPFNEIILHPLVCDPAGRKMSKSVGNVIDPLLIVNGRTRVQLAEDIELDHAKRHPRVPKPKDPQNAANILRTRLAELRKIYPQGFIASGADSLRMALVDYTRRYTKISMETSQVDHFRKFSLKFQNAFKFYTMVRAALPADLPPLLRISEIPYADLTPHDKLLLARLRALIADVNAAFETRELHRATAAIHDFVYDTFTGIYIEFVKKELSADAADAHRRHVGFSLLTETWDILLRLLHPLMPFLTETLWQELDPTNRALVDGATITTQAYPVPEDIANYPERSYADIKLALELIDALREYGRGRRVETPLTHLPFKIALPYSTEGAYIYKMFDTVKMVTRAKGAEVLEQGGLRAGLQDYRVLWRAAAKEAEKTAAPASMMATGKKTAERGWTCWEVRETGERVFVYDLELEQSGLNQVRGLVHGLTQLVPDVEEEK